jgi:hypothetical protein
VRARCRPPARGGPTIYEAAGHPQGVAPEVVTEARARPMQATRKGWPYYIRSRRPPARGGPRSGNGSPCAPDAGHPQGVALLYTKPQATRKGWPYSTRVARAAGGGVVYSRAAPCGLTRGGFLEKFVVKSLERPTERVALGTLLHRIPRPIRPKTSPCKPLAGGLPGVASVACVARARPSVTAYEGWPYSTRVARAAGGGVVYSRATPGGWPARRGVGGLRRARTGFR